MNGVKESIVEKKRMRVVKADVQLTCIFAGVSVHELDQVVKTSKTCKTPLTLSSLLVFVIKLLLHL